MSEGAVRRRRDEPNALLGAEINERVARWLGVDPAHEHGAHVHVRARIAATAGAADARWPHAPPQAIARLEEGHLHVGERRESQSAGDAGHPAPHDCHAQRSFRIHSFLGHSGGKGDSIMDSAFLQCYSRAYVTTARRDLEIAAGQVDRQRRSVLAGLFDSYEAEKIKVWLR